MENITIDDDRDWSNWVCKAKKGQLLEVTDYISLNNGLYGPEHRTIAFHGGEIVMFLGMEYRDWSMTGGPLGEMRHKRKDYRLTVLHGEQIWQAGIIIVEGSFNGFDMRFHILETTPTTDSK